MKKKTIAITVVLFFASFMFYSFTTIGTVNKSINKSMEDLRNNRLKGNTYESPEKETLDFYADGTVVYHANGANVSRKGTYELNCKGLSSSGFHHPWKLKVVIWVGSQATTMEGRFEEEGNTITLNNKKWKLLYHVDD